VVIPKEVSIGLAPFRHLRSKFRELIVERGLVRSIVSCAVVASYKSKEAERGSLVAVGENLAKGQWNGPGSKEGIDFRNQFFTLEENFEDELETLNLQEVQTRVVEDTNLGREMRRENCATRAMASIVHSGNF
jgi:uncharacterized protein YecE (DUF72 family)